MLRSLTSYEKTDHKVPEDSSDLRALKRALECLPVMEEHRKTCKSILSSIVEARKADLSATRSRLELQAEVSRAENHVALMKSEMDTQEQKRLDSSLLVATFAEEFAVASYDLQVGDESLLILNLADRVVSVRCLFTASNSACIRVRRR